MGDDKRVEWVCGTMDVPDGERVQAPPTKPIRMGVAAKKKLWTKGTVLKVRFLDGTDALHARVIEAARSWFLDGVALSLAQADRGERAQIRIAFEAHRGSWSYIGTDCLGIHPSQPTMNLGWATLETPKEDFWGVVVHEWGHTLGLLHEHNHPQVRIEWNKPVVYADLQEPPNRWDRETIDRNVFDAFEASEVITTDFDNASVMIYTIPREWTTNGVAFMPSWKLTEGDAATIRRLYA